MVLRFLSFSLNADFTSGYYDQQTSQYYDQTRYGSDPFAYGRRDDIDHIVNNRAAVMQSRSDPGPASSAADGPGGVIGGAPGGLVGATLGRVLKGVVP